MKNRKELLLSTRDAATLAASFRGRAAPGSTEYEHVEWFDELVSVARLLPGAVGDHVVALGRPVTYIEQPTGVRHCVAFVAPAQAEPAAHRVSVLSPVGRALLGQSVGARIAVNLPDHRIEHLEVIAVSNSEVES